MNKLPEMHRKGIEAKLKRLDNRLKTTVEDLSFLFKEFGKRYDIKKYEERLKPYLEFYNQMSNDKKIEL